MNHFYLTNLHRHTRTYIHYWPHWYEVEPQGIKYYTPWVKFCQKSLSQREGLVVPPLSEMLAKKVLH